MDNGADEIDNLTNINDKNYIKFSLLLLLIAGYLLLANNSDFAMLTTNDIEEVI